MHKEYVKIAVIAFVTMAIVNRVSFLSKIANG